MIDTTTAISAVTLEDAKQHLRVEHTADDKLIEALCLACTQMAEHELGRAIVSREGAEGFGTDASAVPAAIRQWVLLHVGAFYENRQAQTAGQLFPIPRLFALLDPYRTWQ